MCPPAILIFAINAACFMILSMSFCRASPMSLYILHKTSLTDDSLVLVYRCGLELNFSIFLMRVSKCAVVVFGVGFPAHPLLYLGW